MPATLWATNRPQTTRRAMIPGVSSDPCTSSRWRRMVGASMATRTAIQLVLTKVRLRALQTTADSPRASPRA